MYHVYILYYIKHLFVAFLHEYWKHSKISYVPRKNQTYYNHIHTYRHIHSIRQLDMMEIVQQMWTCYIAATRVQETCCCTSMDLQVKTFPLCQHFGDRWNRQVLRI